MNSLKYSIPILIFLVGAHVPKSFTLLYLFVAIIWITTLSQSRNLLLAKNFRQPSLAIQILLILFSLMYSLVMVKHQFWILHGRTLLDFVSSLLLPVILFSSGLSLSRRNPVLLARCLISYSAGALLFLIACLIKTRGFEWYAPQLDPASLLVAWGSETSMNVRSIEQNGILAITFLPIAIAFFLQTRLWLSISLALTSSLAVLAVYPLANGRIWFLSLILSLTPLFAKALISFFHICSRLTLALRLSLLSILTIFTVTIVRPLIHAAVCDERFFIYAAALQRWDSLFAGGRNLSYTVTQCSGIPISVSLNNYVPQSLTMLHSVPLDIVASVGILPFLPLGICLIVALILSSRLFTRIVFFFPAMSTLHLNHYILWGLISTLLPQWLFQPLIYSDGLMYYLSYFCFGALLATIEKPLTTFSNSPFKTTS